MALKSTVCKANINIADMDRHFYQDFSLTVARHPSETDERMMLRILCFALNAHERLEFTRGISSDDEPDLWQRTLSGEIEHWIDLGQPDERRMRKACGRAQRVSVYCYSGNGAAIWFEKIERGLARFRNLRIINIDNQQFLELAKLSARSMSLQVSIDDRQVSVSNDRQTLLVVPVEWDAGSS